MTHPNPSTALARVVLDELSRCGVRLAVISPGSRSGALAIAAAEHPDIDTRVVVDERSAAFHALGAAKASGHPSAVIATSGSAPTHFFPALVEADAAHVPLIAISADRPAELHGVGANQTMDQDHLFGAKVRAYTGIEAPEAGIDANQVWRGSVRSLVQAAQGPRPGPVHLNVRFREPTVPVTDDGRTRGEEYPFDTPRVELPEATAVQPPPSEIPELEGGRGLVIAGEGVYDRGAVIDLAGALGWPVLATALSGMRGGEVVTAYHHLLSAGVPDELRPETVIAVGPIGPSSRLDGLVSVAAERVRIDHWGRLFDPGRDATHRVVGDVTALLGRVRRGADAEWRAAWLAADGERRRDIDGVLGGSDAMTGPLVASALDDIGWETLSVASSLPVRDVDAHLTRGGPVHANRGVSGVDGFVSTSLGIAGETPRALAVSGDISLFHDGNGFIHDDLIDLVVVVVDNGGGGLFDTLPQARHAPEYERLFVTPPRRRVEDLARLHGLGYHEAPDPAALRRLADEALERGGTELIRVEVDRAADLEIRRQLDR